ncbi:PepSY-like domain-containing protein [Sphingobacterium yanglingense]|uniref:Putative PepSY-like beta-lactamase-inhibitor n=1 Tax=Sphingobacterium yanglingense TaxID=1437280 RepID=A0A4R6WSW6_9SPHI|nr:PepSY-like domain-containing protein [Sphingobacterium yanglingense]TDQ82591.1 putative PepSY-like beta-lactamase-inhibitor [Sphingobacterium yanglingense]
MKTMMKSFMTVTLLVMAVVAVAQEKIITFTQLPKKAQVFVTTYYAADQVTLVKEESEFLAGKSYEVKLKDGVKLEFDSKGEWTEVDAELKAVPLKIVPVSILEYVKKSFPNNEIVQISRKSRKYEVELTNGVDLEFNSKGKFVRIDD